MSSAMDANGGRRTAVHGGARLPWTDILLATVASVGWALTGMAATAALGLHLLEADSAGSLGPMTAAAVALGAGGSVKPSGDVSAFGLKGAVAHTAIQITPLGVSLVGALLLSWFFLRSLRGAGAVVAPVELLARAGSVTALFTATLGALAWAGHDVVTIDGAKLGLDKLPGGSGTGSGSGGVSIPGLGDLGNIGGLLPDSIGKLVDAKAAVGFTVETAPTLLGGFAWSAGVLLLALLASRRTPLPAGWGAVHRVVRPAVSALVTVGLLAVAAGLAAAAYAAIGDDHPRRIAGAALLGAPNGTWLGVPLGLFVPWDGRATGVLTHVLPAPLDKLLGTHSGDRPVTLGRLADLDGRVWLLAVAAAALMLLAGVLTAVRTPVVAPAGGAGAAAAGRGASGTAVSGAGGFVGRCAVRLGVATALALPLLVRLTDVSVTASLSVLGFDAFGAGVELHGHTGTALLLGAVWGAGAGAAGAAAAWVTGTAGRRAARLARGDVGGAGGPGAVREGSAGPAWEGSAGPAWEGGAGLSEQAPYGRPSAPSASSAPGGDAHGGDAHGGDVHGGDVHGGTAHRDNVHGGGIHGGTAYGGAVSGSAAHRSAAHRGEAHRSEAHRSEPRPGASGPYAPGTPYRPPNPDTNPYLRLPGELHPRRPTRYGPGAADPTPDGPGAQDRTPAGPRAEDRTPTGPGPEERTPAGPGPEERTPAGPGPEERTPAGPGAEGRTPAGPPPSDDVSAAPTMIGPLPEPPAPRRRPPGDRARSLGGSQDGPPPPPPPPPPAPPSRRPKGPR